MEDLNKKIIFDCHTHYHNNFDQGQYVVLSGYNFKTNQIVLKNSHKPNVYFSLGLAPQEIQRKDLYPNPEQEIQKIKNQIENQMQNQLFVGIGEVGLDNHWAKNAQDREIQQNAFLEMIKLAKEKSCPLIIHSRDAEKDCLELLIKNNIKKAIFHCFGGNLSQALLASENNYYISIPPIKSKERKKIIKQIPLDYLLIESDAPYLGKVSLDCLKSAAMIAEYKNISIKEVLERTFLNAKIIFSKEF